MESRGILPFPRNFLYLVLAAMRHSLYLKTNSAMEEDVAVQEEEFIRLHLLTPLREIDSKVKNK